VERDRMGSRLSKADEELYRRTDEVLHYVWDPIGVSDCTSARDEYGAYFPVVFSLLKSGADETAIAKHLTNIAVHKMGLRANEAHDLKVARLLLDWRDRVAETHC
jgi:hypothetical protein